MHTYKDFIDRVWIYYNEHSRSFPWRETGNPYHILISEFMLQQTQTDRVLPYYTLFLARFPDINELATATFRDVLRLWQGLGYNRRANYLHETARSLVDLHKSKIPKDPSVLETLPGIGPYTSCAISTFAYNLPNVFIETNIRSTFIHEFFSESTYIHDNEIRNLIERTLDYNNPREWYYALMDYGTMIKKRYGNPNSKSKSYQKQSTFRGSNREKRGKIIRYLLICQNSTPDNLAKHLSITRNNLDTILSQMESEGLLVQDKEIVYIKG